MRSQGVSFRFSSIKERSRPVVSSVFGRSSSSLGSGSALVLAEEGAASGTLEKWSKARAEQACKRKAAPGGAALEEDALIFGASLHVVVHIQLDRMRAQPQGIVILDTHLDER